MAGTCAPSQRRRSPRGALPSTEAASSRCSSCTRLTVPSDTASIPTSEICVWRLRELFNKGQYVERAAHREVIAIPEKPRIYRYATLEGGTVAIVFRIRRRDSRGYSDDPKWLRIGDEA